MYNGLLHIHSGLRWIVLVLIFVSIINASKALTSGSYLKKDRRLNMFAMISLHIQFLIGLGLYFINEKAKINYGEEWIRDAMFRFFGLEHIVGMIIAIIIITFGRKKAEKLVGSRDKHRKIMISYSIALILIIASIPWPFREALGGTWA